MTQTYSEESLVPVYPIEIGKSEIVVEDELGCENVLADIEELYTPNESPTPNNAQYNITQSSDVIIGPVTQFIAPVTINQNIDGLQDLLRSIKQTDNNVQFLNGAKLVKSESISSSEILKEAATKTNEIAKLKKNYKILGLVFVTFLLIITVIVIVTTTLIPRDNDNEDIIALPSPPPQDIHDKIYGKYLGSHKLVYRDEWGGRPPKNFTEPLHHPTPLIIISHSASTFCGSQNECARKVKSFQSFHVSKGNADIGYNFVIGGGGNIYVGRGWDVQNYHTNNSIGICFIGDYNFDELLPNMIKAAQLLIAQGVELKKLSDDYQLVCHNQTTQTQSPGIHVYQIVKTWPHFYSGTIH